MFIKIKKTNDFNNKFSDSIIKISQKIKGNKLYKYGIIKGKLTVIKRNSK